MRFSTSMYNDLTSYNLRNSVQSYTYYLTAFKVNNTVLQNSNFYLNETALPLITPYSLTHFFNNATLTYTLPIDSKESNVEYFTPNLPFTNKSDLLWNLFEIYFLRKERTYTKLKYSRCPQYDIVSGGIAAVFAGFLGFLICEKFGMELLDSGDFYIVFMYVVFLSFFLKMLLNVMESNNTVWQFYTYKWLILFYYQLIILTFNFILNVFKKFIRVFAGY